MASARSRRSAVIAGVLSAALLALLVWSGSVVGGLKSAGRVVVAPFAWSIGLVAHPVANLLSGALNYSDVVHQNQQLRAELALAELRGNEQAALRRQLAQITATANLPFVGNIPSVVAEVTSNSPTNFSATITIGKGRLDGVLTGMPVVANGGLIGRIIDTRDRSSTVRLITDQDSVVGCTFGDGAIDVLVYGRGVNHELSVSAITLTSPLAPGTVFATNALQGGLFPPGLPVAKVAAATLTPGSATWDLALRPSADLAHLHYVNVLIWEPST